MNIKILKENGVASHKTGGEYAIASVEIYVDGKLPPVDQREVVIHSIIENFCRNWPHDKVDELTGFIQDGLDQLEEV